MHILQLLINSKLFYCMTSISSSYVMLVVQHCSYSSSYLLVREISGSEYFIHSVGYTVFKNKFEVTLSYHLQICEILVGYEVL